MEERAKERIKGTPGWKKDLVSKRLKVRMLLICRLNGRTVQHGIEQLKKIYIKKNISRSICVNLRVI